jgi:hypothetical protein
MVEGRGSESHRRLRQPASAEACGIARTAPKASGPVFAVVLLLSTGCNTDETSISRFDSLRAQADQAATKMCAASYLYRLNITPEEQEMQRLIRKLQRSGSRALSAAEVGQGVALEQSRRERYIEPFRSEIEALRGITAQLTESAHTLRDAELRAAALKISAHHSRLLDLCSSIAAAQATRSELTERFLQALMERRPVGLPTELEAADAEASKKRREMETVHPQG